LAPSRLDRLAAAITDKASASPVLSTVGDTTAFSVLDAEGRAVVGIQSIFGAFGSGVVATGTGVVLQNRGSGFANSRHHPNHLRPRRRPAHTLMATLVLSDRTPKLLFSTMGGAGQPQTTLQVLRRVLDRHMEPQQAIEAPRWLYGGMFDGEDKGAVQMEGRWDRQIIEGLQARGHRVERIGDWSSRVGHAQAIGIGLGGPMGGVDPRCDGAVASS
jgi:oxamate amidohydrolase